MSRGVVILKIHESSQIGFMAVIRSLSFFLKTLPVKQIPMTLDQIDSSDAYFSGATVLKTTCFFLGGGNLHHNSRAIYTKCLRKHGFYQQKDRCWET